MRGKKGAARYVLLFLQAAVLSVLLFQADIRAEASAAGADKTGASQHSGDDEAPYPIMTVYCNEPVDRVYIIWDTVPGEYTLAADEAEYCCGRYGFLHEYIALEHPAQKIDLTAFDETVGSTMKIKELHTFAVGEELPEWVQIWEPPCEKADLLLFSTHADDELLFFGGTLPYYAGESVYQVQVVYLTNHWRKQPHRGHELLNGLWTCGVKNYPVIGPFEDIYSLSLEHAKGLYDLDEVKRFQVEMLRRFRPDVLLTQDVNGEYGHGVHMLNTNMMMESVELAADESYQPEAGEIWDTPKWYIHAWPENVIEMEWDEPLSNFGGKTAFDVANEAYQCHASQVKYNDMTREKSAVGCTQFGLYRSKVGEDVQKNDFFENIVKEPEPTSAPAPETNTPSPEETDTADSQTQLTDDSGNSEESKAEDRSRTEPDNENPNPSEDGDTDEPQGRLSPLTVILSAAAAGGAILVILLTVRRIRTKR